MQNENGPVFSKKKIQSWNRPEYSAPCGCLLSQLSQWLHPSLLRSCSLLGGALPPAAQTPSRYTPAGSRTACTWWWALGVACHAGNSIHKFGLEENVGVVEHSILEGNYNELQGKTKGMLPVWMITPSKTEFVHVALRHCLYKYSSYANHAQIKS